MPEDERQQSTHEVQAAPADLAVDRFRAELDVFSGPLDLLLHLIKQEEVDIFEVALARITDRYLAAVRAMEMFDINVAAEFLVVAATLMEIKSRTLLPPEEAEEDQEEEDAGMELVRQLLQYKEFRDAADRLEGLHERRTQKFARPRVLPPEFEEEAEQEPDPEALLEDLAVWDLMTAFAEVIQQVRVRPTTRIIPNEVPLSVYIDEVRQRLGATRAPVAFTDFFQQQLTRPRVVGIFLALLELVRRKVITVEEVDGHIMISSVPQDDG